jgi:hypothetical protein
VIEVQVAVHDGPHIDRIDPCLLESRQNAPPNGTVMRVGLGICRGEPVSKRIAPVSWEMA